MGFFDKLFWGASKKFANDVSRGVTNSKDHEVKGKIKVYNYVSEEIYIRKNFLYDCLKYIDLIEKAKNNSIQSFRDDDEINEQIYKEEGKQYFDTLQKIFKQKDKINSSPFSPPFVVSDLYYQFISLYHQVIEDIEVYIAHYLWEVQFDEGKVRTKSPLVLKEGKMGINSLVNRMYHGFNQVEDLGESILNKLEG